VCDKRHSLYRCQGLVICEANQTLEFATAAATISTRFDATVKAEELHPC